MSGDPTHFHQKLIYSLLENCRQSLQSDVSKLDTDEVLGTPTDDLVDRLVAKHRLEALTFDRENARVEPRDHVFETTGWSGTPVRLQGMRAVVHVPLSGDRRLVGCSPTQHMLLYPHGIVEATEVKITIDLEQLPEDPGALNLLVNEQLDIWTHFVEWIRQDIERFNAGLSGEARQAIEARRQQALKFRGIREALDIPLVERSPQVKEVVSLTARRTEIPAPITEPYKTEPRLSIEGFEQLLGRVRLMRQVIEHSPDAFRTINEEHLRFHFLVTLNALFGLEGAASGETFNMDGKTDILLKWQGGNLFVAECKFWTGSKALTEAIDQLLGYLAWRDSKAALLLFVRNAQLTDVLAKADAAVRDHSSFKRAIANPPDGEGRYVLGLPRDPRREVQMALLTFWMPGRQTTPGGSAPEPVES